MFFPDRHKPTDFFYRKHAEALRDYEEEEFLLGWIHREGPDQDAGPGADKTEGEGAEPAVAGFAEPAVAGCAAPAVAGCETPAAQSSEPDPKKRNPHLREEDLCSCLRKQLEEPWKSSWKDAAADAEMLRSMMCSDEVSATITCEPCNLVLKREALGDAKEARSCGSPKKARSGGSP